MSTAATSAEELRKELRAAMGDRSRLTQLHSVVTESINRSYGEEKKWLLTFRQEIKDALECRVLNQW